MPSCSLPQILLHDISNLQALPVWIVRWLNERASYELIVPGEITLDQLALIQLTLAVARLIFAIKTAKLRW